MAAVRCIGTTLTDTTDNLVIADLTSIGEIGIESEEQDVTTLDSPDNFREAIATFKDAGEVPLEGIIKNPANFKAMYDLSDSGNIKAWEVEFQDGSTWVFNAFVKSFKEAEINVDGVRGFTGSLRISGKPTFTAAVSA